MSLRVRMAEEFSTQTSAERQGLGAQLGFVRQPVRTVLVHIAVVGIFGILLPRWLGFRFLNPVTLTAYCCFGVLFAAPVSAESFGVERPKSGRDAMIRVAWAAGYGEAMAIVLLGAGIATLYFSPARAFVVDARELAQPLLLGLAATIAMAAIAALVALLIPSRAARGLALRVIFLALLILFFFDSQRLPEIVTQGTIVCAAVAALALMALSRLAGSQKS